MLHTVTTLDAVDRSLLEALQKDGRATVGELAERVSLACEVGRAKAAIGQPVIDPAREAAVVSRAAVLAREAGLPEDDVRALYWRLMAMSRRAQLEDLGAAARVA